MAELEEFRFFQHIFIPLGVKIPPICSSVTKLLTVSDQVLARQSLASSQGITLQPIEGKSMISLVKAPGGVFIKRFVVCSIHNCQFVK